MEEKFSLCSYYDDDSVYLKLCRVSITSNVMGRPSSSEIACLEDSYTGSTILLNRRVPLPLSPTTLFPIGLLPWIFKVHHGEVHIWYFNHEYTLCRDFVQFPPSLSPNVVSTVILKLNFLAQLENFRLKIFIRSIHILGSYTFLFSRICEGYSCWCSACQTDSRSELHRHTLDALFRLFFHQWPWNSMFLWHAKKCMGEWCSSSLYNLIVQGIVIEWIIFPVSFYLGY